MMNPQSLRGSRISGGMRARLLALAIGFLFVLGGCGGGGGEAGSGAPSANNNPGGSFGPVVALRLMPELGARASAGTTVVVSVLAVNEQGATRDVTAGVAVATDTPGRLTAQPKSGKLELAFERATGPLNLRFTAAGMALDRSLWVTAVTPLERTYSRFHVNVSEVYAGITPAADKSYPVLPGRSLLIDASAVYDGGTDDVMREVLMTSSNPELVSLRRVTDASGNFLWWAGTTWRPGIATITLKWAELETSVVLNISNGLIVQAGMATQFGLTENANGRLTDFMLAGEGGLDARRVTYFESARDNQWTAGKVLPIPDSVFPIIGGVRAAEAASGYRAVMTTNTLGAVWVQMISPDGALRGPVLLPEINSGYDTPRLAVSGNGDAHVWVNTGTALVRKLVRYADLGVATVNSLIFPSNMYRSPGLAVSNAGTVGVAWIDGACRVHYLFDDLSNRGPVAAGAQGSVLVGNCTPAEFANIFTGFEVAVGLDEMAVALQYGTAFNATNTQLIVATRGGSVTATALDSGTTGTAGFPQVGMTESGEAVALWQTTDRGVWAVHRAGRATPGRPFLVEPPEDTLATPGVKGVYSRGDGRFLLSWTAGRPGVRNEVQMREYSVSGGLGGYLSLPFQNSAATNFTTLLASSYGVSAAWSFAPGLAFDEVDAVQRFLP